MGVKTAWASWAWEPGPAWGELRALAAVAAAAVARKSRRVGDMRESPGVVRARVRASPRYGGTTGRATASPFRVSRPMFSGAPSRTCPHREPHMPLLAWLLLIAAVGLGLSLELAFYRARRRARRVDRESNRDAGGGA